MPTTLAFFFVLSPERLGNVMLAPLHHHSYLRILLASSCWEKGGGWSPIAGKEGGDLALLGVALLHDSSAGERRRITGRGLLNFCAPVRGVSNCCACCCSRLTRSKPSRSTTWKVAPFAPLRMSALPGDERPRHIPARSCTLAPTPSPGALLRPHCCCGGHFALGGCSTPATTRSMNVLLSEIRLRAISRIMAELNI